MKNVRKVLFLVVITLIIFASDGFEAVYATNFIDCPDCNNGHSQACKCGGAGEYLQSCDLCGGSTTLLCDLCNGSGTFDGSSCYRCGGDGAMLCNRCGGSGTQMLGCNKPYCSRCGGTGGYPEGSPEHIQQLKDEGNYVEPEKSEITIPKIENFDEFNKVEDITIIENITPELISQNKDIEISPNLSISITKSTTEQLDVLKKIPEEELKTLINLISDIVSTVEMGKVSKQSESYINRVMEQENINMQLICFEEHESIELGFPVEVFVPVFDNQFDEMENAYAYHIVQNGNEAEYLGEAILHKNEDGKVYELSFVTDGFSDFFITTTQIKLENLTYKSEYEISNNIEEDEAEDEYIETKKIEKTEKTEEMPSQVKEDSNTLIIFGGILGIIVVILIGFLIKNIYKKN